MNENFESIEAAFMYLTVFGLFVVMVFAIHDVLKKNDVPMIGRVVVYLVLFLGALGFVAKGIIQLFF